MTQSADLGAIPSPAYGLDLRNGVNASDEALATQNSGTSAPSTTYECMKWCDTSLHRDKQRNEGNTAWIVLRAYSTTAPGVGDDSADGMITGSLWFDATGKAVYVCTDPTAGAAVWVQIEPAGEGGGGGAEITGTVDKILARTADGGASTTAGWHAASGTILHRGLGRMVTAAGAKTTSWAPALGPSVGDIITASAAGNLTLALPTGTVPTTGYRAEYQLRIQNTSASAIIVSYPAYTIEGESGPIRKIPAGATQNYWIATEDGGTTWRIFGTPRREVAFKFFAGGTPTANAVLMRDRILHPTLLPLDHADISIPSLGTAPSGGGVTFTVRRESGPISSPTVQDVMRITFAAGNKHPGNWEMWSGSAWVAPAGNLAVEYQRNDRLTIVCPANLYSCADITWCMIGAEREYQG